MNIEPANKPPRIMSASMCVCCLVRQVARHPMIQEYYEAGPGKKSGDGSPALRPAPQLSPISAPNHNGDDRPV